MQFSFSFYFHFLLSFVGFLALGIYLCRGSWRNNFRHPMALGFALIALSHVVGSHGWMSVIAYCILAALFLWQFGRGYVSLGFKPSEVREGHNMFSLLVGAALFALTVQLHAILFGVPVFQLVK